MQYAYARRPDAGHFFRDARVMDIIEEYVNYFEIRVAVRHAGILGYDKAVCIIWSAFSDA